MRATSTSPLFLLDSTCSEGAFVCRQSPWLLHLFGKMLRKRWRFPQQLDVTELCFPFPSHAVAIPAIGAQYSMFQAAPAPKMIEDGKIHTMEHMISPIAVQPDPASAAAAAAAAAAVIPAVSTPPPFQVSALLQCWCEVSGITDSLNTPQER